MATKLGGKKCFVIMPFGQKMDIREKPKLTIKLTKKKA
jgi:hypothetical protein